MKVEFELTVNGDGDPIIKFRHHERIKCIEQDVLAVFVGKALKNGMRLSNPTGSLEVGTDNCWSEYHIEIDK